MSAVLAALLAVAAAESQEAREAELLPKGVQVIHSPDAAPRTGYELRDAIRRALKRWARPDDQEAQEAAKEFVALYIELERDTKLARSQREKLKARLRYRLLALRDQIAR
ncbi:MAG TPA: hypothetical protein EYP56_20830, partial [Planctomycetaceae bacterium]|nr:hypothetical protein [Planctomycetaceae bacterium]